MKENNFSDIAGHPPQPSAIMWMAAFDAVKDFIFIQDNNYSVLPGEQCPGVLA